MKIGAIPENMLERILLAADALPAPLLHTLQGLLLARTIMAATKLGVFEALGTGALTSAELAEQVRTDPRATQKLLNALVGAGYLRRHKQRYTLTPVVRKWLLKGSRRSLRDNVLFRFVEWKFIEGYEEFVRTGKPLRVHEEMSTEEWGSYQRGMRSMAGLSAGEVARRTPVPKGARTMLDIGGSHGYYSVALCRRHPQLRATILDLPEAVVHATAILAQENMGERVIHRAGNALTEDLGNETWDLVLVSQLIHHFDEASNRDLVRRVARALRPGGILAVLEILCTTSSAPKGQTEALLDLYFAVTSESGTWSLDKIREWQRRAGLTPRKSIRLLSIPCTAIQPAVKPGACPRRC